MLQIAVIMSNPEQSKHLETARMKVAGLELDLVNLRSEEYAESSRIPVMKFGTPEEDALRCFLPWLTMRCWTAQAHILESSQHSICPRHGGQLHYLSFATFA